MNQRRASELDSLTRERRHELMIMFTSPVWAAGWVYIFNFIAQEMMK